MAGYDEKNYFLVVNLAVGGTLGGDTSDLVDDGSAAGSMVIGNIIKQGNLDTAAQACSSDASSGNLEYFSTSQLMQELASRSC